MAKYIPANFDQDKFIPINFSKQILPGSFEYSLTYIIEHHIDTSVFDDRYNNDDNGRPAINPSILLSIILYAYSKGIISSRQIERCCRENVLFMAMSADTQPHHTTISGFVSSMGDEIVPLFRDVLLYCDQLDLIGKEMFAIDGCKLPSNASKEHSGTKAEFEKKTKKLQTAARRIITEHKAQDKKEVDTAIIDKEKRYVAKINKEIKKLKDWIDNNDDKPGKTGKPRKSNITDNESAKMKTSKGVIQGYIGIATADKENQIIVNAEAFGEAQEHDLLQPMVESTQEHFQAINKSKNIFKNTQLTADSGFHSEANIQYLAENKIDAFIADNQFRKRDPRFTDTEKYRKRHKEERRTFEQTQDKFKVSDFKIDPKKRTCICPAGKSLYKSGKSIEQNGFISDRYKAPIRACRGCHLRDKCLRNPDTTAVRQVAHFTGKTQEKKESFTEKMKRKIDSTKGRAIYSLRLGTIEPVFGNLQNKGIHRFTLRTKKKVDIQWKLYCMMHNMEKIHHYGLEFR